MDYTKWNTIKLKYAYHFSIGFTPNTSNLSYYENGVYSWAQISDLNSKVFSTTQKKITLQAITDYQPTLAPKNSLLVSFLLSPGVTSFCGIDTYFNQAIACFPPTNKNSLNYLYYILPIAIRNLSRGAPIYTSGILKNLLIPLPPIDTQKTVSSFLDRKYSLIQELIQKNQSSIDYLKQYKISLIYDLYFKNNILLKYLPLKYFVLVMKSGSTPPKGKNYYNGNIPWVTTSDLNDSLIINTMKKVTLQAIYDCHLPLFPKNCLILGIYGSLLLNLGILSMEATINQSCCGLICNPNLLSMKYLYYFFLYFRSSTYLSFYAKGVTYKRLDLIVLKSLKIPVIPLMDQSSIVTYLDQKCSLIDLLVQKLTLFIHKLKEYQQSLLYETFQNLS